MVFRGVMVERGKREKGSGGEWGFVVQKHRRTQCALEVSSAGVRRAIGNYSVRVER